MKVVHKKKKKKKDFESNNVIQLCTYSCAVQDHVSELK